MPTTETQTQTRTMRKSVRPTQRVVTRSTTAKTTTVPKRSRILEAVTETAQSWHTLGFIDKRKMQQFDVLTIAAAPQFGSVRIKALRERLNLSQAVFAAVLNTSVSTVQKWEIDEKRPSGAACRLLQVIDARGLEVVL